MDNLTPQFAQEQLQELDSQTRLVIIHPNYPNQHVLLHPLLQEDGCLYVRLNGDHLTHSQLQDAVEKASAQQDAKHIQRLIVDEWDRANPAELETFLKDTLTRLNEARIILLGRGMPRFFYQNNDLRRMTRFIPTDRALMLLDYSRMGDKTTLLEVNALGSGAVMVNGRPIDNWGGELPRSLFFYLIDRGIATRNDIFGAFWPEMTIREATNVFHVTKRKISEVLGGDLTTYWSGFYRISPNIELVYDAALFSEAVQDSAIASEEHAQHLLSNAVQFYRGDFLASINENAPWARKRRSELKQTYGETLINLAKMIEQKNGQQKALGFYVRAYATNPQREDIAGNIMKLYAEQGLHSDALFIYKRLETELMDYLNISPAQWLQALASDIQLQVASLPTGIQNPV